MSVSDEILNMFDTESWPTLDESAAYIAHAHTLIDVVEELELELADYSYKLANSNADRPKIGVWNLARRQE